MNDEIEMNTVIHSGPTRPKGNENVKRWYAANYPKDNAVNKIYDKWTFGNTVSLMVMGVDINPLFGGDSLVRERIFVGVSLLYCVPYETIYDLWINNVGVKPPTTDVVG